MGVRRSRSRVAGSLFDIDVWWRGTRRYGIGRELSSMKLSKREMRDLRVRGISMLDYYSQHLAKVELGK